MNKYLLLRDNKQSGPYTLPEIIALGIKPYDLVWLEGKSAAWRYPSEVSELKEYAPAVEEQPFDRFYKKPEAVQQEQHASREKEIVNSLPAEKHDRYQPQVSAPAQDEKKKVYITLPGSATKETVAPVRPSTRTVTAEPVHSVSEPVQSASPKVPVEPVRSVAPPTTTLPPKNYTEAAIDSFSHSRHELPTKKKDRRSLHLALAACILLGLVSGVLLFNYYRQRETLNELNSLVQQIEERTKQQAIPASLVNNEVPVQPKSPSEQPATPVETPLQEQENTAPAENSGSTVRKSRQSQPKTEPQDPAVPAIVFTENKPGERPVERRKDESSTATPPAVSGENLFKLVAVTPNNYKTGVLGGISNLKFDLVNKSNVELHRVAVEVKYLGPEKKVVKKHTVYFENVSPGAQSTIEVPKSNRGVTIEYTITDIKS